MASKNIIRNGILSFVFGAVLIAFITSCGSSGNASPSGLNIQYEVLNLSPDLSPVNLYVNFTLVNTTPFVFPNDNGYFYVPSIVQPYQIRSAIGSRLPIFNRNDSLKSGAKYSLFITGTEGNGQLTQIFTVDTATTPAIGRGKIRFVNASPTGTLGFDIYANGTPAFQKIVYPGYSGFIEIPVGNYDFQIKGTGTTSVLNDMPGVTIQDGRLYTIYAYGYTTRTDSAAFNAGIITNK
jgi:hypothetical protein